METSNTDLDESLRLGSGVLVAACTYNERENLPDLVSQVHQAVPQAKMLIVDDNSPDGSGQWAEEYAAEHAWMSTIRRSGKLGLGSAIVAAMQRAMGDGFQYLVNLDGDLSHPPDKIPELLETAGQSGADVVIGSRYVPGGAIEGWSRRRKVMSAVLNRAARMGLGLSARDCSGAFRCYRVETLQALDLSLIRASGYAMLEEILWLLEHRQASILEVPITFTDRTAGNSKLSMGEAIRSASMIAQLAFSRRR